MKLNSYKITTPSSIYYCTAWTMAAAILKFSERDNLLSEVSEADEEFFKVEPISIEELETVRLNGDRLGSLIETFVHYEVEALLRKEDEEEQNRIIDEAYASWG